MLLLLQGKRAGVACMATTWFETYKRNVLKFINETRAEIAKVVWPTRREVVLTTVMVFIMAALMATFFSIVDLVIRQGLQFVLTYFGS